MLCTFVYYYFLLSFVPLDVIRDAYFVGGGAYFFAISILSECITAFTVENIGIST